MDCEWFLFGSSSKKEPAASPLRELLQNPIARMKPASNDILLGRWEWHQAHPEKVQVSVKGRGSQESNGSQESDGLQESYESRLLITDPRWKERKEFRELLVSCDHEELPKEIVFKLIQDCAAPHGSIYKSQNTYAEFDYQHVYLLLDALPLQFAHKDSYVITTDPYRRNNLERRPRIISFKKGWRMNVHGKTIAQPPASDYVDKWHTLVGMSVSETTTDSEVAVWRTRHSPDSPAYLARCEGGYPLFGVRVPISSELVRWFPRDTECEIDLESRHGKLKPLIWLLSQINAPHATDELASRAIDSAGRCSEAGFWDLGTHRVGEALCKCRPKTASLTWYWTRAKGNSNTMIIKPYEDKEEAGLFGKAQPKKPLKAKAKIFCLQDQALVEVTLIPQTLIHEAVAAIRPNADGSLAKVRWRAVRQLFLGKRPSFETPRMKPTYEFSCETIDGVQPCGQHGQPGQPGQPPICLSCELDRILPSWGIKNLLPKRKSLPHQKRVVRWALHRESTSATNKWAEVTQKDAEIPSLSLSLEAQAIIEQNVLGGVMADNVGAGKTLSALALCEADKHIHSSLKNKPKVVDAKTGHVQSAATLIIVPKNLVGQWKSEIADSWEPTDPRRPEVIVVSTEPQLRKYDLEDFVQAKYIIVSNDIFNNHAYWERLRMIGCAPNIPFAGGRAFEHWLDTALKSTSAMFKKYGSGPDPSVQFWKQRESARDNLGEFRKYPAFKTRQDYKAPVNKASKAQVKTVMLGPAKYKTDPLRSEEETKDGQLDHNYGETLIAWPPSTTPKTKPETKSQPKSQTKRQTKSQTKRQMKSQTTPKTTSEQVKRPWWLVPLFHFFTFRRIIVDEFQYLQDLSLRAVKALSADRRWLVSATPPTNSLQGVNTMAKLLGTKITDEYMRPEYLGTNRKSVGMVQQKSHVEEYLTYKEGISQSTLKFQHDQAYKFVDKFIRQNTLKFYTEEVSRYIVYDPTPADSVTLTETLQAVLASSVAYGKKTSNAPEVDEFRTEYLKREIELCDNAEHALVRCTSTHRTTVGNNMIFNIGVPIETSEDMEPASILREQKDLFISFCVKFYQLCRRAFQFDLQVEPAAGYTETTTSWHNFVTSLQTVGANEDGTLAVILRKILNAARKNPTRGRLQLSKDNPNPTTSGSKKDVTQKFGRLIAEGTKIEPKERAAEMSFRTRELTRLHNRMVKIMKVIRFYDSVHKVLETAATEKQDTTILCPTCDFEVRLVDMKLLATCGHMACSTCCATKDVDPVCPEPGCRVKMNDRLMPDAADFAHPYSNDQAEWGSRMVALRTKVQELISHEENLILVFLQHNEVADHFVEVLLDAGIEHTDARKATARKVKKFKDENDENAGLEKKKSAQSKSKSKDEAAEAEIPAGRVLILMIDTEDAAGWNLQLINHIIFATPLLVNDQHSYDTIMRQAKGRALRQGCPHDEVTCWHFAMAKSADVNVLEDRLDVSLVRPVVRRKEMDIDEVDLVEKGAYAPGQESLRGPVLEDDELDYGDEEGDEEGEGGDDGGGADGA
jgi:hypothetical protein